MSIYQQTIKEIERFGNMYWLFKAVLEFQKQNLGLSLETEPTFEFKIVDQNSYRDELK